jgi:acyl-CoA reductase-like NAD-dependent aldehyde dehydrogenase
MTKQYQAFISGEWVDAVDGKTMGVINPANGTQIATVAQCGVEDVDRAVQAAADAGPAWAEMPISERSKLLLEVSRRITERAEELAVLETMEQGSPLRKTKNFDIPQCAEQFEYFAGVARGITGETLPIGPWCRSWTVREPLGVVGLITPWNFPVLMVVWKLGAALVTGNTCVVKPPSVAPLTTLLLAEILSEAGIPPGVANVITGPGALVGEALVKHPQVAKIGFTGDTDTGKRIVTLAGESVKPVGLELGGKNAFLLLPDANIDAAVAGAVFSAFLNSGQVCAAATRFYVHDSVYDEFSSKFVAAAGKLRMGDPMDMETVMGPLAYEAHRDKVEGYIRDAKESGAKLLLGGERPDTPETRDGFFVPPTIFGDCDHDARFMREEIFGPVVGLCRYTDLEEAVRMANDTPYGLSASVWTRDVKQGMMVAEQIKAGTIWINEHVVLFCNTPWGGCKESGWGKDLSKMVLEEYTMTKHIYLDMLDSPERPWYELLK